MLQQNRAIVVRHDVRGALLSLNPAAAHSLGLETDARGSLANWLGPDTRGQLAGYLQRLRERGQASGMLNLQGRDGAGRVWAYSAALERDDPTVAQLHAVDISDLAAVEDVLRQSEDRYRRSLTRASDGIWIFDTDGVCRYANDAASQMLKRPICEIVGAAFHDFVALAGEVTRLVPADGDLLPVEFSVINPR